MQRDSDVINLGISRKCVGLIDKVLVIARVCNLSIYNVFH